MKTQKSSLGFTLNLLSVLIMSISPLMNKFSLVTVTPLQAAFYNSVFAMIFTYIYIKVRKLKLNLIKDPLIWVLGVTNTLGIYLQYLSINILGPIAVGFIGRFYIIFTIILSLIFLHEKFSGTDWIIVISTIIGSFLVTQPGEWSLTSIWGLVFAFGYTLSFAVTNFFAKKLVADNGSESVLLYNQGTSAVILLVVNLFTGSFSNVSYSGVSYLALSAFFSGFVGLLLFYEGLKYISFSSANIIRSLSPVVILIYSMPFFPVKLTPAFILGALLIVGSTISINILNSKKKN